MDEVRSHEPIGERSSGKSGHCYRLQRHRVALFVLLITLAAGAQTADFPFSQSSTTSPDGRFTISGPRCDRDPNNCDRRLWIRDNSSGTRNLLLEFSRTVRVGWAPSASNFFLNDDAGSDWAEAYVYFPAEHRSRLDIGNVLDRHVRQDRRFEQVSHHYINAERWLNNDTLLVRRFGHFDSSVPGGNEFSVCYAVTLAGLAERLSESRSESASCSEPGSQK